MSHVVPSATISLAGARAVLDAALARADSMGLAISVCVVDGGGHAVVSARMDRAAIMSADIAADKAYTVVAFAGRPTDSWAAGLAGRPEVMAGLNKMPRFCILGGGVPLRVGDQLVGAIGVSGASSEQDAEVAAAGAAAL